MKKKKKKVKSEKISNPHIRKIVELAKTLKRLK